MKSTPLTRLVLPIYLPAVIYSIGTGAIFPVLALAALDVGFDDAGSSAVVGVFGAIGIVASPFLGRLISRIGDKTALATGTVVSIVSVTGSLISLAWGANVWSRVIYVVSLVLLAIGANIWSLARQAYIAETIPLAYRARGLSTLGGMVRLGNLIGPLVSTALLAIWALGSVFVLNIFTALLAMGLVIKYVVPNPTMDLGDSSEALAASQAQPEPLPEILDDERPTPTFAIFVIGVGLNALNILRANRSVIVPLWGTYLGFDPEFITATFAVTALFDTLMFIVSGSLMDKRGRMWALGPSLVVMPIGIVVMILWTTPVGFVVGAGLLGLGNGFGAGIVMTTGADLSPARKKANFLGIWQSIMAIGTAVGPFVVSGLTKVWDLEAGLWATVGIGVAGFVWMALLIRPAYASLGLDLRGRPLEVSPGDDAAAPAATEPEARTGNAFSN